MYTHVCRGKKPQGKNTVVWRVVELRGAPRVREKQCEGGNRV